MAKIRLITRTVVTKLDKRFTDPSYIADTFKDRIKKASVEMKEVLKDSLYKELRKNPVINALINPEIGVRGYDLPAEFGLTPEKAKRAADIIIKTLIKTCDVKVKKEGGIRRVDGKPSQTVVIRSEFLGSSKTVQTEYPEFKEDPFVYESKSDTIPWMEWLLRGSNQNAAIGITPSLKDYGILYDLTPKAREFSRSGRALMIEKAPFSVRAQRKLPNARLAIRFFPYDFPEVARPKIGRNFIDDIVKNTKFISDLQRRLNAIVDYYLDPRKR